MFQLTIHLFNIRIALERETPGQSFHLLCGRNWLAIWLHEPIADDEFNVAQLPNYTIGAVYGDWLDPICDAVFATKGKTPRLILRTLVLFARLLVQPPGRNGRLSTFSRLPKM